MESCSTRRTHRTLEDHRQDRCSSSGASGVGVRSSPGVEDQGRKVTTALGSALRRTPSETSDSAYLYYLSPVLKDGTPLGHPSDRMPRRGHQRGTAQSTRWWWNPPSQIGSRESHHRNHCSWFDTRTMSRGTRWFPQEEALAAQVHGNCFDSELKIDEECSPSTEMSNSKCPAYLAMPPRIHRKGRPLGTHCPQRRWDPRRLSPSSMMCNQGGPTEQISSRLFVDQGRIENPPRGHRRARGVHH
jgi:hypothetical protein